MRNIDMDSLVKEGDLEVKIKMGLQVAEKDQADLETRVNNRIEERFNNAVGYADDRVMQRVSKRDFKDNTAFLLQQAREAFQKALHALTMADSLQTKLDNLDEVYMKKHDIAEVFSKMETMQKELETMKENI